MAEITLNGLTVDTEDIDLLVQHCPLGTLEGTVRFDQELLATMSANDPLKSYWENRLSVHQVALDLADRAFTEGVQIAKRVSTPSKDNYTITKAIIKESKKPVKKESYQGIEE